MQSLAPASGDVAWQDLASHPIERPLAGEAHVAERPISDIRIIRFDARKRSPATGMFLLNSGAMLRRGNSPNGPDSEDEKIDIGELCDHEHSPYDWAV